jgi:hypothetical protein
MTQLADYLQKHQAQLLKDQGQRVEMRKEWVAAVERLMRQIEGWVRQADPEETVLHVELRVHECREFDLGGSYQAHGLAITLGPVVVEVVPEARMVVGMIKRDHSGAEHRAQGLVKITDGVFTSRLYRLTDTGKDEWFVPGAPGAVAKVFDQSTLETILLRLFR